MNRRFFYLATALATVLVMILIVPSVCAQTAARVNIPFAFSANHVELPAGCYQVELQSDDYLALVKCDSGKVVGLMVRTTNAYRQIAHGSLEFRVTGRGNRLTHVRFAGINMQSDLAVQPKPERELARNTESATIEIAMK